MKIGIIGCGHMGSAIAKALTSQKHFVIAGNPEKPKIKFVKNEKEFFKWTIDNPFVVSNVDMIFIAVKPNLVQQILYEIKSCLKPNQIIISIAAGIPLEKLKRWSGFHGKIVRVMPNLPAQVFAGISVWKSQGLKSNEKKAANAVLKTFGRTIEVKNENLIDMATAISGGGPAYTAAFLESMFSAAKKTGFSEKQARELALQTVLGSISYLEKTSIDFEKLKNAVQTKGGTTEAGFKILKKKKWQNTLEKAFFAGYEQAKKLSE